MTVTDSGVAVIRLDCQGEKQNTLSKDLLSEFEAITEKVDSDASIKSVSGGIYLKSVPTWRKICPSVSQSPISSTSQAVLLSGKKDSWM